MDDQWMTADWHASVSNGIDLTKPQDTSGVDAEEMPKPFLNEYLPTPAEIRSACQAIRCGWTASERRRREGYRRANRPPRVLRPVRSALSR
jgi:hypothetical protein